MEEQNLDPNNEHASQDDAIGENSSAQTEPTLRLVMCTHCEAKFGVPIESILQSGELNPQLHCSRCDSLFLLEDNEFFGTENEFISANDFSPVAREELPEEIEPEITPEGEPVETELKVFEEAEPEEEIEETVIHERSDLDDNFFDPPSDDLFSPLRARPTAEIATEELTTAEYTPEEIISEELNDHTEEDTEATISFSRKTEEATQEDLFSADQFTEKSDTEKSDTEKEIVEEKNLVEETTEPPEDKAPDESPSQMDLNDFVEEDIPQQEEDNDTEEDEIESRFGEIVDRPPFSSPPTIEINPEDIDRNTIIDLSVGESDVDATIESNEFSKKLGRAELHLGDVDFVNNNIPLQDPASIQSGISTLFFASPLIGFVLLLFGFGEFIVGDATSRESFEQFVTSDIPSAPPRGLFVESLRFRSNLLISGQKVYSLNSKLVNDTDLHFSKVFIEGILFDADGKMIAQKQMPIGKAVNSKTELPNAETLLDMQDQYAEIENRVAPEERRDVALYFSNAEASGAKFYTARIYSALKSGS